MMSRKKVAFSFMILFSLVYAVWVGTHYGVCKIDNGRESDAQLQSHTVIVTPGVTRISDKPIISPPAVTRDKHTTNYNILLVGYLRGGTTFTGNILGLRRGNFYIYEPLHAQNTWGYYKPGHTCSIKKESCIKSNGTDALIVDTLRGLFNCDINTLQRSLLIWQVLKGRGYGGYLDNPEWIKYVPECHGEERNCVEKFVSYCANSSAVVIKIPRISLGLAAELLNTEPNLKIIHLLRDPRGIMQSRNVLKWTPPPGGSISLCNKMTADYVTSDLIRKTHPGRLLTIFYEDLVTLPTDTVRRMYEFAGFDFDKSEQIRLGELTGVNTNNTLTSSDKKTSLQKAMGWRTRINQNFLDEIDPGCTDVYKLLGYPLLHGPTELQNLTIPLRMAAKKDASI